MSSTDDILDQIDTALADRGVSFDAMRCTPDAPLSAAPMPPAPSPTSLSIQGPDGEWHDLGDCITSITYEP